MLRLKTAFFVFFFVFKARPGDPLFSAPQQQQPFVLRFLHENAKRCKACDTDLCHRKRIIPFDLIFAQGTVVLSSEWKLVKPQGFSEGDSLLPHHEAVYDGMISILWFGLCWNSWWCHGHTLWLTQKLPVKRVGPSGWYPGSDTVPKC